MTRISRRWEPVSRWKALARHITFRGLPRMEQHSDGGTTRHAHSRDSPHGGHCLGTWDKRSKDIAGRMFRPPAISYPPLHLASPLRSRDTGLQANSLRLHFLSKRLPNCLLESTCNVLVSYAAEQRAHRQLRSFCTSLKLYVALSGCTATGIISGPDPGAEREPGGSAATQTGRSLRGQQRHRGTADTHNA